MTPIIRWLRSSKRRFVYIIFRSLPNDWNWKIFPSIIWNFQKNCVFDQNWRSWGQNLEWNSFCLLIHLILIILFIKYMNNLTCIILRGEHRNEVPTRMRHVSMRYVSYHIYGKPALQVNEERKASPRVTNESHSVWHIMLYDRTYHSIRHITANVILFSGCHIW